VYAAPWEQDRVVATEFARGVHVWSLGEERHLARLETHYDSGGRRAALVPGDPPVVLAGAWERHGVCAYDLAGQLLWQNRQPSAVQHLTVVGGGRVVVGYERTGTRVLDVTSGEEVRRLRGVRYVVALRRGLSLGVGNDWYRLLGPDLDPCGPRVSLRAGSWAVVSAAADDEGHLVVKEAGGPLRFFTEGQERVVVWTPDDLVPHVAHDPATRTWVVVREIDDGDSVRAQVVRLDDDGRVLEQQNSAPLLDAVTVRDGRELVLLRSGLEVMDCATLRTRTLLPSPASRAATSRPGGRGSEWTS
jgi:hypothetical protein